MPYSLKHQGKKLGSDIKTPGMIAFTYGVLGGTEIAVGCSGTVPVAMKWFPPRRKGLVTGIVVAGVGMAALLNAPLANWLVGAYGIQGTFQIMGVGTTAIVVALGIVLRNPPEHIYSQVTTGRIEWQYRNEYRQRLDRGTENDPVLWCMVHVCFIRSFARLSCLAWCMGRSSPCCRPSRRISMV